METLLSLVNRFSEIPMIYPVYFFYGAAFLFLGISISVKNLKESDLKIANSLWLLGAFGIAHGIHEWLELFRLGQEGHLPPHELYLIKLIILHLFVLSFFFLMQFGLSLINALDRWPMKGLKLTPAIAAISWITFLLLRTDSPDYSFLQQTELGIRRTLGVAGMLVTSYGLVRYAQEIKILSRPVSTNFRYAGIAFIPYALFGGSLVVLPLFNDYHLLLAILRGVSAVVISYFIIRALNIFDIETRRKIEHQARLLVQTEKMSSLGRLAAGIAHEINNPLANASLLVQMMKKKMKTGGTDPVALNDKLEAVEKHIDRASLIASELLQFSRQGEAEFVSLDINKVISTSLKFLLYKFNNIDIEQKLIPPPEMMGDPRKLEQVFINIFSNAIEAMPRGGKLVISSALKKGILEIGVSDTGEGIAAENLSRIFDPFFTTKEIGTGTGLGLFICYGIIKQHGGSIEVSSTAGKGTIVTIILPVKE